MGCSKFLNIAKCTTDDRDEQFTRDDFDYLVCVVFHRTVSGFLNIVADKMAGEGPPSCDLGAGILFVFLSRF